MRVIWTPRAERRAVEAYEFIARERPQAAVEWLRELLVRVSSLDRLPQRGRVVPEINRVTYRELLLPPYRIIYRVDAKQVVVLTLRHSRRNWDAREIPPEL